MKCNIGPLQKENNDYTADSKEMADLLAKQYTKVFSKPEDTNLDPTMLFFDVKTWRMKDVQFSVDDITREIDNTSCASSGPDGLPIKLLQKCPSLPYALHLFLSQCWAEETTVQSLKEPLVVPIHKGGSKRITANYHPISITSHIVNIFERIIRKCIIRYIEINDMFNSSQHGFRIGRSCLSQLLQQYDTILSSLESGDNVDVVYIDFAKAFDKVDFDILLEKNSKHGIGGKLGRWLHSFLTGRTQRVIVNGILSVPSPVMSGVPQGSVLGLLLFLILIGDIDEGLSISVLSSFADDTRMVAAISTLFHATNFQADLEKVYDWARINKMEFNDVKFELLRYWLNNHSLKCCTSYTSCRGSIIDEKEVVKDLGVLMFSDGTFTDHIKGIITKVKKIVPWILRTFNCRTSCNVNPLEVNGATSPRVCSKVMESIAKRAESKT